MRKLKNFGYDVLLEILFNAPIIAIMLSPLLVFFPSVKARLDKANRNKKHPTK